MVSDGDRLLFNKTSLRILLTFLFFIDVSCITGCITITGCSYKLESIRASARLHDNDQNFHNTWNVWINIFPMQLSCNLYYQEEEPSIFDSIFILPATNCHVIIYTPGEEHIDKRHHTREFVHTTYNYTGCPKIKSALGKCLEVAIYGFKLCILYAKREKLDSKPSKPFLGHP